MRIFMIACMATLISCCTVSAQVVRMSLDQAVAQALQSNGNIQAARFEVRSMNSQRGTASEISKLSVNGMFGEYNSYARDNNVTISQSIPFPTVFGARGALGDANIRSSELSFYTTQNEVAYRVSSAWYQLASARELNKWYVRNDSLWGKFAEAAEIRFRTGEGTLLEKANAQTRYQLAQTSLRQNRADIEIFKQRLKTLLNTSEAVDVESGDLQPRALPEPDSIALANNPQLLWYKQQVLIAEKEKAVEKNLLAPDLTVGYFNQTLIGTPRSVGSSDLATSAARFQGFQAGITIPLWVRPQLSRIKSLEYKRKASLSNYQQQERVFQGELIALWEEANKLSTSIQYYQTTGLPQAELILKQADRAFRSGEIQYIELIQSLTTAADVRFSYLEALSAYNESVLKLELLLSQRQ